MASGGKNTSNIDAQGEDIDAPGEPNPYAYLYHEPCIRTSYKNPYYQKPICDAIQGIIFIRIPDSGDPTTDIFKIPGCDMPKHDNTKLNLASIWRDTTEKLSWMRKSDTDTIDEYRFSLRQPVEKWYMMLRVQCVFPELSPFIWQCHKLQAVDVLECLWTTPDEGRMPLWMDLKSINVFIRPHLHPVKARENNDLTSKRISGDPFDGGLNQLVLTIRGYLNNIKEAKARRAPLKPTKITDRSHV
ncbi:hypothetical protein H072_215 [Dactylellina haptotyla CBS 200.50]|uniref:Uncharacterized protein n=1 Tax=Dactylellina haptotyla (strain CBS 200.50) TaxID=1284197 RepID=S8ASP7_DACHA|nr:hypothetical protein H072_215 [Dactylellina haptotyla CBS 200.50]